MLGFVRFSAAAKPLVFPTNAPPKLWFSVVVSGATLLIAPLIALAAPALRGQLFNVSGVKGAFKANNWAINR